MGADRESSVDEHEFARQRLTAAAYGFASWPEFRSWRKRNPIEYRARSRRLLELPGHEAEPGIALDLSPDAYEGPD